jgi:hypothetical protein
MTIALALDLVSVACNVILVILALVEFHRNHTRRDDKKM